VTFLIARQIFLPVCGFGRGPQRPSSMAFLKATPIHRNGIRHLFALPAPDGVQWLFVPFLPVAIRPRRSRSSKPTKEKTMTRQFQKPDIHQEITNRIVDAIETAGDFKLPWIKNTAGCFARPVNIASNNPYNGINVVSLWVSAMAAEFPSNVWGTYRQWQAKGYQVRKGEKSSPVVFYKKFETEDVNEQTGEAETVERMVARASRVFNAAQVEGFEIETPELPEAPVFDPLTAAEEFAADTGAQIREGGDRACFIPSQDLICMPERRRFTGTDTTSPVEAFYSTLFHELIHWTGADKRLDRDLSDRFGSESYAVEELVAELGAAFLCSDLQITATPREDHASYIKSWLAVLKNDKKAILTAAAKAQQATDYLLNLKARVAA
jgi:antirestriction protein ArdC